MNEKGFTMLEIMLVMTVIVIATALTMPIYQAFQPKNDIEVASTAVANGARRAQILSQASNMDSAWGIKIETGKVIVFKGDSYEMRDQEEDEIFEIAKNISISGITEIVFSKTFGMPNPSGEIILRSINNDIKTININEKGTVSY